MDKYTVVISTVAGVEYTCIEKTNDDGTIDIIPMIESNSDYQAYLRWLENPDAEENGTIS